MKYCYSDKTRFKTKLTIFPPSFLIKLSRKPTLSFRGSLSHHSSISCLLSNFIKTWNRNVMRNVFILIKYNVTIIIILVKDYFGFCYKRILYRLCLPCSIMFNVIYIYVFFFFFFGCDYIPSLIGPFLIVALRRGWMQRPTSLRREKENLGVLGFI